ncbi:hypothetical protein [Aliikangiella maris]|uniref:Uncharacterized protein n=2 Tax=Aliikangiella maris TaxID=3162458 RepID=A0ABV3MJQ6_9GAMM
MLAPGIHFDTQAPISSTQVTRMDIACFAGFIPMQPLNQLPGSLKTWLINHRWYERIIFHQNESGEPLIELLDIPIPIDSWRLFTELFAPDKRINQRAEIVSSSLSASVLIEQSDQKLYVVIDNQPPEIITFNPGEWALDDLVIEINQQLNGAFAYKQDFVDQDVFDQDIANESNEKERYALTIQRIDQYSTGSINIYQNKSLGFVRSTVARNGYLDTYLGATVRAFFQQGGQKCYVIRAGDPLIPGESTALKIQALSRLLYQNEKLSRGLTQIAQLTQLTLPLWNGSEEEQHAWHGLGLLHSLNDVSFVSLPDLPDLLSCQQKTTESIKVVGQQTEFTACIVEPNSEKDNQQVLFQAPVCDETGFLVWARIIRHISQYLIRNFSDTLLISSIPLPAATILKPFEDYLQQSLFINNQHELFDFFNTDQIQLAFPWLMTYQSKHLPARAELPEGRLAGLMANQARHQQSYFSLAGNFFPDVFDLFPKAYLGLKQTDLNDRYLQERICWITHSPNGIQLQSDVTPANSKQQQYACVKRLTMLIHRLTRQIGISAVFEPNSAVLWNHIQRSVAQLLMDIYRQNALKGKTAKEAFSVRCDKTTMTRQDHDNGRVIVQIMFQPALPIEKIIITLNFDHKGSLQITEESL